MFEAIRNSWLTLLRQRTRSVVVCLALLPPAALASSLLGCGARSGVELLDSPGAGGAHVGIDPSEPATSGSASAGAPSAGAASAGAPSAGASAGGAPSCESVTVSIDDLRPAITLMIDQSLSMRFGFPTRDSPITRWSIVGQALFDPNQGVVKTFESSVRFGVAFFTGHSGACPLLSQVSAATGNYAALDALYQSLSPEGDTPTGESMSQIVMQLKAKSTAAPQSIVLVTDGDPDTCAQPLPDEGQPEALAAVRAAHAAGVDVYVLGISDDIAGAKLQQLANAGRGKPIELVWGVDADAAQPYKADSSVLGLTAQLADLLNRIPFCEVNLQRDVARNEASSGQVSLDGQPLAYSDSDGFALRDPRHLEIVGQACEALKSRGKQLSVRISCN